MDKVQRLTPCQGVGSSEPKWETWILMRYPSLTVYELTYSEDIVSTSWRHEAVHKRTH